VKLHVQGYIFYMLCSDQFYDNKWNYVIGWNTSSFPDIEQSAWYTPALRVFTVHHWNSVRQFHQLCGLYVDRKCWNISESVGFRSGTADIWKDCRACKTSVITCPMAQCHNPKDLNLQQYSDLLECSQMDVCMDMYLKSQYRKGKSSFALHLLENGHDIGLMENIMNTIHITDKGRLMDTLEVLHILWDETKQPD